jgi:hypothetical protein
MKKINLRNLYLLVGISALDICLGVYERLIPTRGYIYMVQTTLLSPWGEVPRGTTILNMTNSVSMVTVNTNTGTSIAWFVLIVAISFVIIGSLVIAALTGDEKKEIQK